MFGSPSKFTEALSTRTLYKDLEYSEPFTKEFIDAKAKRGDPLGDKLVAQMEEDGTLDYTFSGTFNDGEYRYEHTGMGSVPVTTSSKQYESYQGTVLLNPDAGTFNVTVFGVGISHVTRTRLSDGDVKKYDEAVGIPILIDGTMEYYGAIQDGSTNVGDLTLEWQRIEPGSAPDEETPG